MALFAGRAAKNDEIIVLAGSASIESGSFKHRQWIFCLLTGSFALALNKVSPEAILEHVPQRLSPILPTYFLAFDVGPPEVTNAELTNAKIALASNLGTHLHFDSEVIRC
jgi:hypothetical protein